MSTRLMIAAALYALAVNLLSFAAMAIDKARAGTGSRRIPEATLLRLALVGGSLGTIAAQRTIRHKTRKEPFRSRLAAILLVQVVLLAGLGLGIALAGSPEALWRLPAS